MAEPGDAQWGGAGSGERDAAAVRVLPPLVPIAAVVVGTALDRLVPIAIRPPLATAQSYATAGAVIALSAIALVIWTLWVIGRSGQNPDPHTSTPSILDHGPFSLSRNPIYLGMVLFCLGFAIRDLNPWLLLFTPAVLVVLHVLVVLPEERYLEAKFGEPYRAYQRRVRRWI